MRSITAQNFSPAQFLCSLQKRCGVGGRSGGLPNGDGLERAAACGRDLGNAHSWHRGDKARGGEGPSPPGGCSHQQVDLLLCKNSGKAFPLLQATLACLCFEGPVTSCFCSTTRGPLTILASLEVGVVGGR